MVSEIKEWVKEEAEDIFKRIEKDKGRGEWFDIDWKLELNFENTRDSNKNTTQRAISGFANTYGGALVIGFKDKGDLQGVIKKPNIDIEMTDKLRKKITPQVPEFKARYYLYNEKEILVIFVPPSKKPLRCDNGVYYYREQSQFLPMTYEMLETKFRRNFDEEKYLFLVRSELEQLMRYAGSMCEHLGVGSSTCLYSVNMFCTTFLRSGDKLHQCYKENNLLVEYHKLSELLRIWCIGGRYYSKDYSDFRDLKRDVEPFLNKIKEIIGVDKGDKLDTFGDIMPRCTQ